MKLNIKTLFAASLATLAVSCTDLDVPVDSQYTKYPGTEEAIVSKMAGIYFQMRECFGRRYMEAQALSSDEFIQPENDSKEALEFVLKDINGKDFALSSLQGKYVVPSQERIVVRLTVRLLMLPVILQRIWLLPVLQMKCWFR